MMVDEKDRGLPVAAGLRARRYAGGQLASQKATAQRNWHRIFGTIVIFDGPSAKDIAEITGLSQSTVAGVLEQMHGRKLISLDESVERMGRGRRPRPIRINRSGNYVAGVEILPDQLTGVVVDLAGTPIVEHREKMQPTRSNMPVDPDMVVDGVRDLVEALAAELREERADAVGRPLMGLGVELGGHVDGRTGAAAFSPALRWGSPWTAGPVPLRQRLRDATRLYTVVDNDANALGVAQQWFGEARTIETFQVVLVRLDGIGAAYFADGELIRGATGKANELGHLVIESPGEGCRCGHAGCVEAHAAGPAVLRLIGDQRTGEDLGDALRRASRWAEADERGAREAFRVAGDALGRGLASLLNINDPARVIFMGKAVERSTETRRLVLFNDYYHDAMWKAVTEHTFATPPRQEDFLLVEDEAQWDGPRGAATLVIRDIIAGAVPVTS